ncbi:centromere protein N [Phyllostomus discolor]|uniref:Centromere protein N n=1 Tax=Phyllostomus discolor TaxID=89673 RepID=A0A7E6CRI0_9CHIR|nr:centromere protein N [Phyllostomus discolor]
MDETVAEFVKRTILKIPVAEMMTILQAWGFYLKINCRRTSTSGERKESLVHDLVLLCEEKRARVSDAALLDIIYTQFHRHQKVWDVFQMTKEPGGDIDLFDMKQFKSSFKKILQRALKMAQLYPAKEAPQSDSASSHMGNSARLWVILSRGPFACNMSRVINFLVSVTFRDAEENAVWIRIAWGTQYRKPNQYKPTYVVYYPQTPYAFISSSQLRSSIPLLGQALTIASKHHRIVKMDFRSRYLDSLKAIVFEQYNQTFETHNATTPLQERSLGLDINMDSRIIHENRIEKDRVQKITEEVFGDYPQPRLEFAQYKLETKFKSDLNRGILAERNEPLRCLVKFSSPNLLEALKSLAPAGIADAPLSPLLTCIPKKRMNYFKIKDK